MEGEAITSRYESVGEKGNGALKSGKSQTAGTITVLARQQRPNAGPQAKPCHTCERIQIGANFNKVSDTRIGFGLFFVYAPLLVLPFVLLGGLLVYTHLRLMGASNVKTLKDFLPGWESHRYKYKTQIVKSRSNPLARFVRHRAFWIFNCSMYCPLSVAVLEWTTYLTKTVENWWCPFRHEKKPNYAGSAIDYSFWHTSKDVERLHSEDRDSPVWNQDAPQR